MYEALGPRHRETPVGRNRGMSEAEVESRQPGGCGHGHTKNEPFLLDRTSTQMGTAEWDWLAKDSLTEIEDDFGITFF